ncbi:MAG: radical SAM protein, partial [Actinomycetota bacterium]|nr:radical SAM protein [Actinomycetota bacterium]
MPAEQLFEVRRRTFDTPHFKGIEFIEAEAKSILNNVPGNYLPFNWTINPYRGCTHSCTYCLSGETPILMGDGRTKPLSEVRVGDAIYGTKRGDTYGTYVITNVLAHWQTVKPAYRVTLQDGTKLICSGDHRFLTKRGWKHATAAEGGPTRPCLTIADSLVGTGAAQEVEKVDDDPQGPPVLLSGVLAGDRIESNDTLRVVSVESLGFDTPMFDITTGTGDFIADGVVSHNCFARSTHTYMDMNAGRDFETKIVVKVNAPQLLRKELRAKRWKGEHIAMGTATDPYQRAEGRYKIMPEIIKTLTEYRNPFSILTKGTLILRDLELLLAAANVTEVSTALSIGTLDEDAWRSSEPGTPHPRKRMEAVRKLNDAGIPCGVMVAPVLPGISDRRDQLEA